MALTGLVFVFAYFSGLVLGLVRHPFFALATYVAVFYLHPPSRWWGHFLPDLRWSLVAAAVTLIAVLRYRPAVAKPSWLTTTPAKLLLAYTAWLWIQYPWALDKSQHLECAFLFSKYLVVYYIVYQLIDTQQRARAFLLVHLAGCMYLGMIAYGSYVQGRLDGVGGPGIDDSNTLGMQLATGAIVGVVLMLREKKFWLAFCAAATALSLNAIVMTGSRGAFLALLLGGLLLVFLRPKGRQTRFVVIGVAAVIGFGMIASQEFWERMHTLDAVVEKNEQLESSAESRVVMARAQLEMAKKYPFGNGHRGTEYLSARYLDAKWLTAAGARSSHNTFLTALVEQGIPGALLYFGYVLWGARSVLRVKALTRGETTVEQGMAAAAAAAGLLVVLIGGMFADFLKVEVQIWLAAVLAALLQLSAAPSKEAVASATADAAKRALSDTPGTRSTFEKLPR